MSKLIPSMIGNIDSILAVRDSIGAPIQHSYLVTRSWSGGKLGLGDPVETKQQILPSPRVVQFAADSKFFDGGVIKQGDILLKMISKNKYPTENLLDCVAESEAVEKFYVVGDVEFQILNLREKHLTWDAHLRRRSRQGV